MIYYFLIIFLSLAFSIWSGNWSNLFLSISFFLIGRGIIHLFSSSSDKRVYGKIFSISFLSCFVYAIICFIYMKYHNYEYLLTTDTITSYVPQVSELTNYSWNQIIDTVLFSDNLYYRHSGIILFYWTFVSKISSLFDSEIYFNLQISVFFLSSFIPVFLYRILKQHNIPSAHNYALIYFFFSVVFYYSTLILRDAPIALLYVIAFSYYSDNFWKKTIVFIITATLVYFIRPQMGAFLCLFYICSFIPDRSNRNAIQLISLLVAFIAVLFVYIRIDIFDALAEQELYDEKIIENAQNATLYIFNDLPVFVREFCMAVYIHLSPIPCWSFMGLTILNETNNFMSFPRMIAVLYNFIVLVFIAYGIPFIKGYLPRLKDRALLYGSFLFLMLQVSSTEQRRLMICYPILFLFASLVYQKLSIPRRRFLFFVSLSLFFIFQFIGVMK